MTPRRRPRGPCGLRLRPPTCRLVLTVGVCEVSRFSCMKYLGVPWGLRLRRTEQRLALALLFMLPSAHYKAVGVRIASFVGSRSGAVSLRFRLPGAPRFLWEWTQ